MRLDFALVSRSLANQETGETGRYLGDRVVICAGPYESPKLLLRSASAKWPPGIGNAAYMVGRHLVTHTMLWVRGAAAGAQRQFAPAISGHLTA